MSKHTIEVNNENSQLFMSRFVMILPKARTEDMVVQNTGKELLLYDLTTHKAYHLNETSAVIYNHCDGHTTFDDIKLKHLLLTDDIIYFALDQLKRENLIEAEFQSVFAGMSRRDVIRKVGFASMIALPMVSFVLAPTAAHAVSGCVSVGGCHCPGLASPGTSFISQSDCLADARDKCCSGNGTVLDPGFCAGGACVCQVTCT